MSIEFTKKKKKKKKRLNLHVNWKLFTFPKRLLRNQETLEKKSKRPNGLESLPFHRVLWNQNHSGWYGKAANHTLTPVSGIRCCISFSVSLCSPKWQKDEQLPAKSAPMSSLTCRPWVANLPYRRQPFLVLCPLGSDRNLTEKSVETCGSNLDSSLLATAGSKEKEGNGTPLPYSCLENSMDGGAW